VKSTKFNIKCGVCGEDNWSILYEGLIRDGQAGSYSSKNETIWKCNNCSVAFFDGEPIEYTSSDYREKVNGDGKVSRYYELHDQQHVNNLSIMNTSDFRGKIVADVGCGAGSFLDLISGMSTKTIAIEPNSSYQNVLSEKNYEVFPYALDALKKWRNKVDLLVSFYVIEHIINPIVFLKELYELLTPGGKTIICTPNTDNWLLNFLPGVYDQFFYRTVHRWYFNEKSIKHLAEITGFKIEGFKFMQRYDISNALFWIRDSKATGNGKENVLEDINVMYRQTLEKNGKADYIYAILKK